MKFAFGVELLDAVVAGVGDPDVAFGVDGDRRAVRRRARRLSLWRRTAGELPAGVELLDAVVAGVSDPTCLWSPRRRRWERRAGRLSEPSPPNGADEFAWRWTSCTRSLAVSATQTLPSESMAIPRGSENWPCVLPGGAELAQVGPLAAELLNPVVDGVGDPDVSF